MRSKQYSEKMTATPDLEQICSDFEYAVNQRESGVFRRLQLNLDARNAYWKGQHPDGRKHKELLGEDVFPWDKSSDARVPLVDLYVNEDVAFLMTLWQRMRIIVSGVESNDTKFSSRMTHYLRWLKYTQIGESRDEAELLANYFLERGAGVMKARQRQLEYREITGRDIMKASIEAQIAIQIGEATETDPQIADLADMVKTPGAEKEAGKTLEMLLPELKAGRGAKVAKDLRETGKAKFPYPYVCKNRPAFMTLAPNEDVFLAPEAVSLQDSSSIYQRELITETTLMERVQTLGYGKDWAEEMKEKHRGQVTHPNIAVNRNSYLYRRGGLDMWDAPRLFEVVHAYRRLYDDEGVPGIYYTCFSPRIKDEPAYHDLLNYQHGEYPFVLFQRERRTRLVDDSRGYGEIASTWQQQIKAEWDQRIDRASITTCPPSYHPPGEEPDQWGPGVQVPTVRPDDYGFMETPDYDPGSKEVEESVRKFSDAYFGRPVDGQNSVTSVLLKQSMGEKWMACWAKVDTQTLQLSQQFSDDKFYYRVVGSQQGRAIQATREEIQGKFDIFITYNTANLDPEYVKEQMGLMERALSADVNGIIDRDEALAHLFDLIDPNLGERLLRPGENAQQKEIEEAGQAFANLRMGVPVNVKPGQAYQMRLQVLEQLFMNNPGAQEQYEKDEVFKANYDRYTKQLKFQLQQRQNAIIGRLGA
jgi:hypothetical protein